MDLEKYCYYFPLHCTSEQKDEEGSENLEEK